MFYMELGKLHLAFVFQVCVRPINLHLLHEQSQLELCLPRTSAAACRESSVQRAENATIRVLPPPRAAPPEGPCCGQWSTRDGVVLAVRYDS